LAIGGLLLGWSALLLFFSAQAASSGSSAWQLLRKQSNCQTRLRPATNQFENRKTIIVQGFD
jgi:hypothetical protein